MAKPFYCCYRLSLLLSFVLIFGCSRSEYEQALIGDHEASFAFPLFSTNLVMGDLMVKLLSDSLSNDTLFINPDNTMTLYYTGDVAQKPASDIFTFFENGIVPLTDSIGTSPIQAPDGVSISRADLSSGTLLLIISNNTTDTITGIFEIPQMKLNGVVFRYPFKVAPTPNSAWISPPIPVDNHVLNSQNNILEFKYYAYKPDGTRITFPLINGAFAPVFVSFQSLKFSYIEGYWGYSTYPLTRDTIEIDLNQTSLDASIKVKDPRVTMRISNSWGFPTRGVVKYLSFIGRDGTEIKLESSIFQNNGVDFNYPSYAAGEIGETKTTDLYMDETNSNIAAIFNLQPVRLVYEVEGVSNANQDPSITGFLTDSSNLKLTMQVELLLEGAARNFRADQTLDLDFGSYAGLDTSLIEEIEFKLVTENRTPVAADLQIQFIDGLGQVIDSLFSGGSRDLMRAAPVNADGVSTGVTRTEEFIKMDIERFQRVRNAKTAFVQTAFTTAEGGDKPVKLLATDHVVIKMGVKVKTRL